MIDREYDFRGDIVQPQADQRRIFESLKVVAADPTTRRRCAP
jgi:hypothetical protein